MRILHLISQHPEATGSGFYLQNLIRQAVQAGHQNYLIAGVSEGLNPVLAGVTLQDCRFVRFESRELPFLIPGMSDVMPYPSSRFSTLPSELIDRYEQSFAAAITDLVKRNDIELIHSHHLWLASAVARRCAPDLPLVTSCHSTDLRQFVTCSHLQQRVLQECRAIDRVLALDPAQAERIVAHYGIDRDRIDIVGAGFDAHHFRFARKPPTPPVQVLYAGKLSLSKGVDWLVRVFAKRTGQAAHLHLAGSGSGREEEICRQLAGRLGSQATLHGSLSQPDLAKLMRRCHVFVLPSFYEGLPLVLLEALASGCRIVTTDLPGCRHVLGHASAELVRFVSLPSLAGVDRPANEDWPQLDRALADALAAIIEHTGHATTPPFSDIEPLIGGYSWEGVFARITAAYAAALDRRRAP